MVWSHSLTVYWQCMLVLIDILQGMPVMNTRNILNCARYRQFHVKITVTSSTCCSNSLKTFYWNNKTTFHKNYRQLSVYSTDFASCQQFDLFWIWNWNCFAKEVRTLNQAVVIEPCTYQYDNLTTTQSKPPIISTCRYIWIFPAPFFLQQSKVEELQICRLDKY